MKIDPIRFPSVAMFLACGERDITDLIFPVFREDLNLLKGVSQISQNNRITLQRIFRREQDASLLESPLGHGLHHHIHIARMVKMSVSQKNGVKRRRIAFRFATETPTQGPWARVDREGCLSDRHPEAS